MKSSHKKLILLILSRNTFMPVLHSHIQERPTSWYFHIVDKDPCKATVYFKSLIHLWTVSKCKDLWFNNAACITTYNVVVENFKQFVNFPIDLSMLWVVDISKKTYKDKLPSKCNHPVTLNSSLFVFRPHGTAYLCVIGNHAEIEIETQKKKCVPKLAVWRFRWGIRKGILIHYQKRRGM